MSPRLRRTLVTTCGIVSLISLLLGASYTYVSRTFFNADVFASRVADGLSTPEFSSAVAEVLTDQVIAAHNDLLPYRPLIVTSVERVVGFAPFRAVVEKAVKETHATILSETGTSISLTVNDAGVIVRDALAMNPEIASQVPPTALAVIADENGWPTGKHLARVMRIAHRSRTGALLFLVLSLATGIFALGITRHRERHLLRYGLAMAISGVVIGALAQFGGPFVASTAGTEFMSLLIRGLWAAFVGPLALRMWVFAGIGLVVVAGVTSTFSRVDTAVVATHARRWLWARPHRGSLGLLRGAALAALGGLAAFHPTLTLQVLAVTGAGLLFFLGIQEVFLAILKSIPGVESAVATPSREEHSHSRRMVVAVVIGVVIIGAGTLWYVREDRGPLLAQAVATCNGHPELLERRFDQVAFAGTHNSMSAGDVAEWMFPNQQKGIRRQLEDGVRAFLLDVHYAAPVGDRVKTIIEDGAETRAAYEQALGKDAVDAAMRLRDRMVGEETGDRDVYLCHGFCELGASRFVHTLETIYEFLVVNRGEVIVIIIQDEGVTPQDVAACFEESGLDRLLYRGSVTAPWPTMREMVDGDQRVVVLGEHDTEGVPWYHPAFEVYQETPYRFLDPSEFSNQPGRGGTSGPLLLMNHWIESTPTPRPSNAEIVNAYDFLLARARACQQERGMIPNLVAVDFYRSGDLLRVVETLNGFESPVVGKR